MSKTKIKKLPIIPPLLLLIIILAAYTLLNNRGTTAASSLSLGQQYLNKLDYGGAIASFTRAVELDPNNSAARIGLAQAYAGLGEYDFAEDVLSEMVYTNSPEEEATLALLEVYRSADEDAKAVRLVQVLINTTDKDSYYQLRSDILSEYFNRPRSIASGSAHTLRIDGGRVLGRGDNSLGQLGTEPDASLRESFVSVDFSGTAVKVACINSTSLVIDSEGRLWATGENRWGQLGGGYASTSAESGWQEIPLDGKAADVAGTAGRLLVLLTDGSLWQAGAGDLRQLTRLSQFSTVTAIAATQQQALVLTADGKLWSSWATTPDLWSKLTDDATCFGLSDSGIGFIDSKGHILRYSGSFYLPDAWYEGEGYVCPDGSICGIASSPDMQLLRSTDGKVFAITGGAVREVTLESPAVNLYAVGEALIIEQENGAVSFITGSDPTARSIDEY